MINQNMVPGPEVKKKKKMKALIIFGSILGGIILLGILGKILWTGAEHYQSGGVKVPMEVEEESQWEAVDGFIAILPITGVISASQDDSLVGSSGGYNHEFVLNTIDQLIEDENNVGLILFVDSPGGGVYESDELYFKILEYQEYTGRPVYSSMGSMAASGGYYISAPADKIIANRNCWTGSIGVTIGAIYDITGLLEKHGIKAVHIDSGKNKAMGSMTQELTKEQKEIFQSLVDESYEQFVDIVAQGRDMNKDQVISLADGRLYTAKQAKENGLIDEIGTLDDAIFMMQDEKKFGDCEVYIFQPEEDPLLDSLFAQIIGIRKQSEELSVLLDLMAQQGEFPISYMCEVLQ